MILLGSIVAFLVALFAVLHKRVTEYLANATEALRLTSVFARVPVSTQAFTWFSLLASIAMECSAISTPIPGSFLRTRLLTWSLDLAVVVVCDRFTSQSSCAHVGEQSQDLDLDAEDNDIKIFLESPVGVLERLDVDEQDEPGEVSYPSLLDFMAALMHEWLANSRSVFVTVSGALQSVGVSTQFALGFLLGCIVTSAFFVPESRVLGVALLASFAAFAAVSYHALIKEEVKRRLQDLWNASAAPAICFIHEWVGDSDETAQDHEYAGFHFLEAVDCMAECFVDSVGPLLRPISSDSKQAFVWICAPASFVVACFFLPRPIDSDLVLTGLPTLSAILAISIVRARVVPPSPIMHDEPPAGDEPVVPLDVDRHQEDDEPQLDLIEALALSGTSESEAVALALEPSLIFDDGLGLSTLTSPRVPQSPGSKAGLWIRDIFNVNNNSLDSAEQPSPSSSARAFQTNSPEGADSMRDVPQAETGSRRFSMRDSMRDLCNAILASADLPPMRPPSSPQAFPTIPFPRADDIVVEKEKVKPKSMTRFSPFTLRSRKSANRGLDDKVDAVEGGRSAMILASALQPAFVPVEGASSSRVSVHFREPSMDADAEDGDGGADKRETENESGSSVSGSPLPFRDVLNTPPRKVQVAPIVSLRGLRSPVYASPSQSESEKLPTKVEMKEVRRVMLAKRRGELEFGGKGKVPAPVHVPATERKLKGGRGGERAWLLQMDEVREEDVSDVSEW